MCEPAAWRPNHGRPYHVRDDLVSLMLLIQGGQVDGHSSRAFESKHIGLLLPVQMGNVPASSSTGFVHRTRPPALPVARPLVLGLEWELLLGQTR